MLPLLLPKFRLLVVIEMYILSYFKYFLIFLKFQIFVINLFANNVFVQPVDLITNGIIKSDIRACNGQESVVYLASFVTKYQAEDRKPAHERNYPTFKPPLPTVDKALLQLFSLTAPGGRLNNPSYQAAAAKCFINAGNVVDPSTGEFRQFRGAETKGTTKFSTIANANQNNHQIISGQY